ncbi:MAG: hypothetical protein II870_04760 [Synergistaceae bacterium]|nr:hypothetical protein [Synergistaceae bacterium]MBQ7569369.1 hypothetical protein [Synergistaceae bacterium]MBQ9581320.1 hypothetical protein [Synergistaceae bacterium]MBR0096240.1 hypothetical protein [Synergistaceae bacterium]
MPTLKMSFKLDSHYAKNLNINETMDGLPSETLKYIEATRHCRLIRASALMQVCRLKRTQSF